ncbi:MAG: carboxylating nicotinate-nucleotide diphosphorylase [Pseudomonadales bacterium]|nr:carboxylating nicotinate-nucleotide diphosphorylase [Pseudomonadales bacterium]
MDTDYLRQLDETVRTALSEDIGNEDVTANLIDADATATARVITREAAVICGRPWVDEVFRQVDARITVSWNVAEGDTVAANDVLFTAQGPTRGLLTAERAALNFLQTMSGTATATHRYVELIRHTGARLLDTRKTLPGLRRAQKYAVHCGGGTNHRMGLYDAFLIKENHIAAAGSIAAAITRARSSHPDIKLEIEVETLAQLNEAVAARPDWIMLDNFSLDDLRTAVAVSGDGIKLEASGGIDSPEDLVAIAETGVDFISVGALTKHVRAVDLSMRLLQA